MVQSGFLKSWNIERPVPVQGLLNSYSTAVQSLLIGLLQIVSDSITPSAIVSVTFLLCAEIANNKFKTSAINDGGASKVCQVMTLFQFSSCSLSYCRSLHPWQFLEKLQRQGAEHIDVLNHYLNCACECEYELGLNKTR